MEINQTVSHQDAKAGQVFHDAERRAGQDEIYKGLQERQAHVSPKFLYNPLGSKLFEAICELPEYYLTRTEASIFEQFLPEIQQAIGTQISLIDLGAGNCEKAAKLFPKIQPLNYVPVDISAEFLAKAASNLQLQFPMIQVMPLEIDFSKAWSLSQISPLKNKRFFYPGSSLGNFPPEEALAFLKNVRLHCDGDSGLLIGVDLVKERKILESAYDDSLGVTASFNLNILHHLNEIAGTDFQIKDWKHEAYFNSSLSRMEMHLVALRSLTVSWPGGKRVFRAGETIHTENSYKYTESTFQSLLKAAGFKDIRMWKDPQSWYLVCYAQSNENRLWN